MNSGFHRISFFILPLILVLSSCVSAQETTSAIKSIPAPGSRPAVMTIAFSANTTGHYEPCPT